MKKHLTEIAASPKSTGSKPKTANEYFRLGVSKFNSHNYKSAISHFTKTLEVDPFNTMAYYYRGSAKIYLRDACGAIDDLTTAVAIPLKAKNGYFGDSNPPEALILDKECFS